MGGLTDTLNAGSGLGSLLLGAGSTAASAAGDIASGVGLSQQYTFQSQVAMNNAAIDRANATAAIAQGSFEESASKLHTGQILASQKTAYAAGGIDVGIGSPAQVRDSTAKMGALDAALLHYNASRTALGLEQQAANDESQANIYKMAASNAKTAGYSKAATTILSGASSLANKWSQFQLSGVAK